MHHILLSMFILHNIHHRAKSLFHQPTFVVAAFVASIFAVSACGDPAVQDYIEDYAVESLLVVGEPIRGVRVLKTVDVVDSFSFDQSAVRTAKVRIFEENRRIDLQFRADSIPNLGAFFAPDTVRPNTNYRLEVELTDSRGDTRRLTGNMRTPPQIAWVRPPRDTLFYPQDTVGLPSPDSLAISWTPVPGATDYIISVQCLDTLNYGIYLRPPTQEKNRRMVRFFEVNLPRYNETIRFGFRATNNSPLVWTGFKWFGKNRITIYAPDNNWLRWYRLIGFSQNPRYNPLLGSIEGGKGVFGSAAVVRRDVFMYKNQP